MVTSTTKKLAIIGNPINHSKSPTLHNTYLEKMKKDYIYLALKVNIENLKSAVDTLKDGGFKGFNVTIPHKTNIIKYLDFVSKEASQIGAVNTVLIKDNKLYGYNTDAFGFITPLKKIIKLDKKISLVLGAGGASRAVIYSLLQENVDKIYLGVRNKEKGLDLKNDFKDPKIEVINFSEVDENIYHTTNFIINTTPIGMTGDFLDMELPIHLEKFTNLVVAYDLIYTPKETKFLKEAKKLGIETINGEDMLLYQGGKALEIWLGENIDYKVFLKGRSLL